MTDIDYFKKIDSPTLVNAIELLQVRANERGFTPDDIRCLFPEPGRMCGYAVTAQAPKPAVIVLQEIGGYRDYAAHCGEVMATFFTRFGAVGLVTDCAIRDLPEVRRMGFQFLGRGSDFHLNGPRKVVVE